MSLKRCVVQFNRHSGFSLVEMAAVMIIFGILLASGASTYNIYTKDRRIRDTYDRLDKLNDNMQSFFEAQGRYPCPADPSAPENGTEDCGGANIRVAGGRAGTGYFLSGVESPVYIGAIPYRTLRLGIEDINPDDGMLESEKATKTNDVITRKKALDGWNRQFTYIVTEALTSKATFDSGLSAIAVKTESGTDLVEPSGTVAWVALSHGENGAGAYTEEGGLLIFPCKGKEADNCSAVGVSLLSPPFITSPAVSDITIVSGLRNTQEGVNYFNDIVYFSSAESFGVWDYARNDPIFSGSLASRDIVNNNTGFVGIGTKLPEQKLDVVGDVKVVEVHAAQICNQDGTKCFGSANFGSVAGNLCGANQLVTGISAGAVVCTAHVITPDVLVSSSECVGNEYALGITSGGSLICGTP